VTSGVFFSPDPPTSFSAPIGEFPLLGSLAHALASYDGAAELERGLNILLTGLATTLSPAGAPGEAGAPR
jgi:hypothetical protein